MTSERHTHFGAPEFKLHDAEHDRSRRRVVRKSRRIALLFVLMLLAGLAWTLFARWSQDKALDARATENAILHVLVIHPGANRVDGRLTLPGTLQGIHEAQIHARANGYVKQWFKDIGASVRKGEVLATLDLPEVSRQVDEAAANFQLAKSAYERWRLLRADDAVSQQELDEKASIYRQSDAGLKRLREQLGFGQVVAPFDGIVTRRNVNVGDLVNAGNGGSGQAMFAVAQVNRLHLYVYVPQERAALVKVGDSVDILQANRPGETIKARVTRTAGAIDQASHTLQVDIDVPNPNRALLPGAYVEVAMNLDPTDTLQLPTNTLLFGAAGPQVALVKDGKALRQNVVLGTDYGHMVAVKAGVSANDNVIVNPPDSIASGQAVIVETPPAGPGDTKPRT